MSLYNVNKVMRDVSRSAEVARRWKNEPEAVLEQYDLMAEEREALKDWHVRKLYDMGASPFLLLVYSSASGRNMRDYIAAMNPKN